MKTITLAVCAVLPSAWKAPEAFVEEFIRAIFSECLSVPGLNRTVVVFSVETDGRENWHIFDTLTKEFPDLIIDRHLPSLGQKSTATAILYLSAFQIALNHGADLILEMDASGAHDAKEIVPFIKEAVRSLSTNPNEMLAVMSTRFSIGGKDCFPRDRVLLSRAGTVFAQALLMLGPHGRKLTDLTSGFEAFSAPLVKRIFVLLKPDEWVSMRHGPMHLFQTEARALVFWIAQRTKTKAETPVAITEKPITFGADFHRKLAPLSIGYLARAFIGGLMLMVEGWNVLHRR